MPCEEEEEASDVERSIVSHLSSYNRNQRGASCGGGGGGVPPPKLRKRRTPQMAKYKATNGDPTTKNEDEKRQHKSCSFEFLKQINQQQINLININQSRA
jgi:hypothetical protein